MSFEGLSSPEAARRLAEYGPNAPPPAHMLGVGEILLRTLREPMFFLLALAAGVYLLVGDLGEGLFMVAGAGCSIALVVVQELRSEKALEALQKLAEPTALVRRDGEAQRIPARDLVPGDILLVGEGQRLPADGQLVAGDALLVDESTLTGESAPVTKILAGGDLDLAFPDPGGDETPFLFGGTMVTRGSGVARIVRTGARTAIGGLGASLAAIEGESSPLQKRTGELVARLGVVALFFCALVTVAYGLVHQDWFEGAIAGITLAIGLLPEEFPMVLAIFLALGAYRLARRNVLVRRSSVTETLGAATLLCVDKTGTLTRNHMEVARLYVGDAIEPVPEAPDAAQHRLLQAALRASSEHPVDPMDRAVHDLTARLEIPAGGTVLESFPIRPELLAFIQTWRIDGDTLKAAKGAPEAVLRLAGANAAEHARIGAAVEEMAREGLRVLAVAEKQGEAPFVVLGLVGFEDPIREDVPQAVAAARRAGVSVAMITGDYPATALAIARAAGIDTTHGAKTGAELSASTRLAEDIRDVRVFARVTPASKLALVEAFKADGHIVAMTGDGVNDGPALAAAHIGVAMGLRGSDVAREAAHIVLLDDSFPSIVAGIELGRRISNNLRKALTFVVAIHIPIAGLALAPILMGLPPMLLPAHVVLMELLIDPTCSLAFEAEPGEKDAMLKPPRPQSEPLFGTRDIVFGAFQGLVVLLAVLSVYVLATSLSVPEAEARGLSFATLIIANLSLALSDALPRGISPFARENRAFWAIAAVALSVVVAGLYFPPLAGLLRFAPPPPEDLAVAALLAVCAGGWWGILRRLFAPQNEEAPAASSR